MILVLRPEPGASATVARAEARGLRAVATPLFTIAPLDWASPSADSHDALMLTSANAARKAGPRLGDYRALPAYAVGEATAAALRAAGLRDVRAGAGDAEALLDLLVRDGRRRVLHIAGEAHRATARPGVAITRAIVYRAVPAETLAPGAEAILRDGGAALLHSPGAGRHLAALVDAAGIARGGIALAAISAAAAEAAGDGWRALAIADRPTDDALLAAAERLCERTAARRGTA